MKRIFPLALIAIRADFPIASDRVRGTTSRICGSPLSKRPSSPVWLLLLCPKSIVICTAVNRHLLPVHSAPLLRPLKRQRRPAFAMLLLSSTQCGACQREGVAVSGALVGMG